MKRSLSVMLSAALVLSGMTFLPAWADDEKDYGNEEEWGEDPDFPEDPELPEEGENWTKTLTCLGTGAIIDPVTPSGVGEVWKGNYVYYGKYDNVSRKYRVLDTSTTDYSADNTTQTMLLDCDSVLMLTGFDEEKPRSNIWKDCSLRAGLNGDSFLEAEYGFTQLEKAAIAESTKAQAGTADGCADDSMQYTPLEGDKIFLLDVGEITNESYGYASAVSEGKNHQKSWNEGQSFAFYLRSVHNNDSNACEVGMVGQDGSIGYSDVEFEDQGVSPAFNVKLSSVFGTTLVSGETGTAGAAYKLTLIDNDMDIQSSENSIVDESTVSISYEISGNNADNANCVSVMILDKEYTQGNTNNARILAYGQLETDEFDTVGMGTFTLPDSLAMWEVKEDYHIYIIPECIYEDGVDDNYVAWQSYTDYAGKPEEITLSDEIKSAEMSMGTRVLNDPEVSTNSQDGWEGQYVYYGTYGNDTSAVPVKYRVLDASTTEYSEDGVTQTMLLDCDSALYIAKFSGETSVAWDESTVRSGLNGSTFLDKEGVFTDTEKNAIIESTKSKAGSSDGTGQNGLDFAGLEDKIFLLDAVEATRTSYGYSESDSLSASRQKTGGNWWLRSTAGEKKSASFVGSDGAIRQEEQSNVMVSPAFNLKLSEVLFTSISVKEKGYAYKKRPLGSVGVTSSAEWKVTLKDYGKTITILNPDGIICTADKTVTIPYRYTDSTEDGEKVNQISVMITNGGSRIICYGALQNIKDSEGNTGMASDISIGTGTFSIPEELRESKLGEDYRVYLLAEHVNEDDSTDYASEPLDITSVLADAGGVEESPTRLGVAGIQDPIGLGDATLEWKGCYVWYGRYDVEGNGTATPVRYRVLDSDTTDYSAADGEGNKQRTMLLDCDTVLCEHMFDEDGLSNDEEKSVSSWDVSDVKNSMNGSGFLDKEGVFTEPEKSAIAVANKEKVQIPVEEGQPESTMSVALNDDKIFLLDELEALETFYGYDFFDTESAGRVKDSRLNVNGWWLRAPAGSNAQSEVRYISSDGSINSAGVCQDKIGVSPAFNVNLSSVLFSTVVTGKRDTLGSEYKLTILDDAMTIAVGENVVREGNTIIVPSCSLSGADSTNATQLSVLILDKEYQKGNANGANIISYKKTADVEGEDQSIQFTLPTGLTYQECGSDYYVYLIAEDINGLQETDYASEPVKIAIPELENGQIVIGTEEIHDPEIGDDTLQGMTAPWKGCSVYYGMYDASPVRYHVLDASTTEYSQPGQDGKYEETMLLDSTAILYGYKNVTTVWSYDDVKNGLNGDDFLNKAGVFTTAEKRAIATSTKEQESESDGTTDDAFVPLTGEKVFLLGSGEARRLTYGFTSRTNLYVGRTKAPDPAGDVCWLLRSGVPDSEEKIRMVGTGGEIDAREINDSTTGISPAFNLKVSDVLFSSVCEGNKVFAGKTRALEKESAKIGTTTDSTYKLTLRDADKTLRLTEGKSVLKTFDGTITVPYTYTDNATDEAIKVNQISVVVTDKLYTAKNIANARILYYGALQNIKDVNGVQGQAADVSVGTGTFELPEELTGTLGQDYYIYLLAEHVNVDDPSTEGADESLCTDYASEPIEVTNIVNVVNQINLSGISTPEPEQPLVRNVGTTTGVSVSVIWKQGSMVVNEPAEWAATYSAVVKLAVKHGYSLEDAAGNTAVITVGGNVVKAEDITRNADGTITVDMGEYTTARRKIVDVTKPSTPDKFSEFYTKENVCSSLELGTSACVLLEGTAQPVKVDMSVVWSVVDSAGKPASYDAAPDAENIFQWKIQDVKAADYDTNGVSMEGTVTIQNKALQTPEPQASESSSQPTQSGEPQASESPSQTTQSGEPQTGGSSSQPTQSGEPQTGGSSSQPVESGAPQVSGSPSQPVQSGIPAGTEQPETDYKRGDVDGDGNITLLDAQLALKAALKLAALTGTKEAAADVDGDGRITLKDAQIILKVALKLAKMEDYEK